MNTTRPRALVVFESMFGNTAQIAAAVADGLRRDDVDVVVVDVREADPALPAGLDLLVVGGPTHGFSLSRASTRADAVRQGAPSDRATAGLREWLTTVSVPATPPALATFDTRVAKVRWMPKAAATAAARLGGRRGLRPVARPVGFSVDDVQGPLLAQELEHARAWGRELGAAVRQHVADRATGRR